MGNQSQVSPQRAEAGGCLTELGWLGAGFVLPWVSPTFYRLAARRRVGWAVLFFLFFSLVVTVLATIGVMRGLAEAGREIQRAFERGEFPEITISGGVAQVSGPQPRVLLDEGGTIVVIDTTGTYTQIDRNRYEQGFLLTRTSLHILSRNGRYQEIPLSALHESFGDPIVIDADTASQAWAALLPILALAVLVGLAIWHILVRFAYVALLALLVWGVASLFRRGTGYGPVLIIGLYAAAPTIYANYLLGQIGIGFPGLWTILLLLLWAVALALALPAPQTGSLLRGERPLRGWRALLGLPWLLVLASDAALDVPRGELIAWPLAIFTLVALLAIGLWTAQKYLGPESGPIPTLDRSG